MLLEVKLGKEPLFHGSLHRRTEISCNSPYVLRRRNSIRTSCQNSQAIQKADDDCNENDDRKSNIHPTEYETLSQLPEQAKDEPKNDGSQEELDKKDEPPSVIQAMSCDQISGLPYCKPACLLGLAYGSNFDESCPNLELHRRGTPSTTHMFGKASFCTRVQDQLAEDLERGLTDLAMQGARGRVFKITLLSHGYTIVAKGTRDVFIPDLKHEARVYDHLRSLQGDMIPVYLGNIDLELPWWDIGYCIEHMLLLSWGGESIHGRMSHDQNLEQQRIIERFLQLGVDHEDVRTPNTLWDEKNQKLVMIDFERSKMKATPDYTAG